MNELKISHCKLDSQANIIEFDDNFSKTFNLEGHIKLSFKSVFNITHTALYAMKPGDKKSFIMFYNTTINQSDKPNALLMMYLVAHKKDDGYTVSLTNWLNWLHNVRSSLENSYLAMSEFNNTVNQNDFNKISDAACYKALYPLLTYLPNKSSNGVNQISLYEVMRVFMQLRDMNYSRDYSRNINSRIRTSLKKDYGHNHSDAIDVIKNQSLLNIDFDGEILIPNTVLANNIIIPISHDYFLVSILKALK